MNPQSFHDAEPVELPGAKGLELLSESGGVRVYIEFAETPPEPVVAVAEAAAVADLPETTIIPLANPAPARRIEDTDWHLPEAA